LWKNVSARSKEIPIHFHRDDENPIIINMLSLPRTDDFKAFKDGTEIANSFIG